MPEGDTLAKVAARLRPALDGQRLVRFEAPRLRGPVTARPAPGEAIDGVESRGKHLLVHFGGGLSLRTHLRMSGSWHLYRAGERWQRPRREMRVLVEADNGWLAVCFNAPDVELYRRPAPHDEAAATAASTGAASGRGDGPGAVERLGPDLCLPDPDLDAVLGRLDRLDGTVEVGDALLNQQVAAGVGNVYKSEACFARHLDPFTPLAALDAAARRRLWATAHRQLRDNLGSGPRRTHGAGLAVYGRPGRPCPRCGATIRVRRQGPHARSTYWCPGCQRRPPVPPP